MVEQVSIFLKERDSVVGLRWANSWLLSWPSWSSRRMAGSWRDIHTGMDTRMRMATPAATASAACR
jgi:hypothetical protein